MHGDIFSKHRKSEVRQLHGFLLAEPEPDRGSGSCSRVLLMSSRIQVLSTCISY